MDLYQILACSILFPKIPSFPDKKWYCNYNGFLWHLRHSPSFSLSSIQTNKLVSENLNKESNPPTLPVIAIICLTGVWISGVCFSFILPVTDTKANWKGFWYVQETRNIELLVSIILDPEFMFTFWGEVVLKFAIEAIVVIPPVKAELKGEPIFPSDGLILPGKPIYPLVAKARVFASPQTVWIIREFGPQPEFSCQANVLVQI